MFKYMLHRAILNIRMRKGLTQKVVALRANVAQKHLSLWERGDRKPQERQLEAICEGLGCTVIELWEENVRLQEAHYTEVAIKTGVALPTFTDSKLARDIELLMSLEMKDIPSDLREPLDIIRSTFVSLVTQLPPLMQQIRKLHGNLQRPDRPPRD